MEDYDLIVSSFQSQYGLRLSKEIHTMPWEEFRQMLIGISPDTALGRIVAIRSEDDKDILKHFTKEQKRIRSEWRNRQAKAVSVEDRDAFLESMKQAFLKMAGGGADG